MNFLHLTTFYPPYSFGGDGLQVYRLCHALAEQGHHVDVVQDVDSYHLFHPEPPGMAFAEHPNVVRHELRSGAGWVSPLLTHQTGLSFLKRKKVEALLEARDYDVVHFHNISLLGAELLALPAGRAVKMYTAHEHWLVCPLNVLWKMNRMPCDRPECLRCTLQAKRPPQFWRYSDLLEKAAAHVDQFLAPSRFTAEMHAERGFQQPFACLPNFVDRADEDWRQPEAAPQANAYFLFVGRLEWIKGVQTLIALWDKVPDGDLLIAGTGTAESDLRAMAAGNGRIKFLGARSQKELGALYFHARACIVPSLTYETFGLTVVEAFARKTPAVVRNLGALPELIQESGGGMAYGADEELIAALRRIAESPILRNELGARGYEAFLRLWCRERHLEGYFEYLDRAKNARGTRSG